MTSKPKLNANQRLTEFPNEGFTVLESNLYCNYCDCNVSWLHKSDVSKPFYFQIPILFYSILFRIELFEYFLANQLPDNQNIKLNGVIGGRAGPRGARGLVQVKIRGAWAPCPQVENRSTSGGSGVSPVRLSLSRPNCHSDIL
jgi:hypothetical protein